ncbi:MAG TPA: abortive infection protein [Clostridiales bacterium]|nr:abortive infection protein [Clostridiales bacterium]
MNENKLIDFLNQNNGYIKTRDFEKLGISRPSIQGYIDKKIIRKVSRGLYIDNTLIEDEFYILQQKFSNIIFSYNTACYLLNLSDRAPYKIDVTTLNHNNISEDLEIHYVAKDKFEIGITEIKSPYGNPIKVYNAERCICDLLKNKNEVDIELYNKIINNYFKQKHRNLITLEKYAKEFNILEKFENIMEVLI